MSAILIGTGCLFILSAIGLIGYNIWDDRRAQNSIKEIMEQLDQVSLHSSNESSKAVNGHEEILPDYVLDPNKDMPTIEINGFRYIGTISIPSLELELPVMETWDYTRMKISPCRYFGSAYLNNLVICAHNYASHFGRLKNLIPGDLVFFTDMDGNQFNYEVSLVETLSDTAVNEMQSGRWDLTLFTCTVDGYARVTVRCSQVKNNQ